MSRNRLALLGLAITAIALVGAARVSFERDSTPVSRAQQAHEHAPGCGLEEPAFCDSFDAPSPGGRAGDLDESRWSFARVTQAMHVGQGILNQFVATEAALCREKIYGVLPPRDSFFCDAHGTESMHWMEALNDDGAYIYNSARIRQPFDFADRTGRITFDVDAKTQGNHSWWVEVWITDEPVPAPHIDKPGTAARPRNGIGLVFSNACRGPWRGNLESVELIRDYEHTRLTEGRGLTLEECYTTGDDVFNHFEVRISRDHVEVWATDAGATNLQRRATASGINLPFTRGYVSFQHTQYNAAKFGAPTAEQTYHWDNIGFDGPVLPIPRGYDAPDALTRGRTGNTINLAYALDAKGMQVCCTGGGGWQQAGPLVFDDVDLRHATGGRINLNVWYGKAGSTFRYRLNGGGWQTVAYPFPDFVFNAARTLSLPVPLHALRAGRNTLEFAADAEVQIANIDLTVDLDDAAPRAPAPTRTPGPGHGQHGASSAAATPASPSEHGNGGKHDCED